MKFLILPIFLMFSSMISAQFHHSDFKPLYSLVGSWEMKTKKGSLIEEWKQLNDSTLYGRSYRINGKDTIAQETIELKYSEGLITYTPTVPDQNQGNPVPFTLENISKSGYLFTNSTHDFPQRILYLLNGNKLDVTISGMIEGNLRQIPFGFVRK